VATPVGAGHILIMASVGHLAVGLLAGRLHGGAAAGPRPRACTGALLAFAALAELPDIDVVGVAFGLPDVGDGGHRGASHSFVLALALGLASALVARRFGWPFMRTLVAATLAVASHGVLDALGEGGRGIPMLWPLSDARYMSPWRILPDAPRGLAMLSRHGLLDLLIELVLFFPAAAFALWPTRTRAAVIVLTSRARARPSILTRPPGRSQT
jgi:inner membrane protein